jgi:hypothetical protein
VVLHAAGNVTLYVYLKQFHMWETEVDEWLWALKQWKPPSAATAAAAGAASVPDRPLAVDVGANRGWFTIKAAMAGARVAAFEGEPLGKTSFHLGTRGGGTPTGWPHTAQSGNPTARGPSQSLPNEIICV